MLVYNHRYAGVKTPVHWCIIIGTTGRESNQFLVENLLIFRYLVLLVENLLRTYVYLYVLKSEMISDVISQLLRHFC